MLRLPANFIPDFEAQTQFSGKTSISVNSLSYLSNCEWEQHSQRGISQVLLSLSHLRYESPQKLLLFSSSKSTRRLAQMSLRIKWSVMRYDHEHTSLFTRNMDRMKCWMYVTGGASSFLLDLRDLHQRFLLFCHNWQYEKESTYNNFSPQEPHRVLFVDWPLKLALVPLYLSADSVSFYSGYANLRNVLFLNKINIFNTKTLML